MFRTLFCVTRIIRTHKPRLHPLALRATRTSPMPWLPDVQYTPRAVSGVWPQIDPVSHKHICVNAFSCASAYGLCLIRMIRIFFATLWYLYCAFFYFLPHDEGIYTSSDKNFQSSCTWSQQAVGVIRAWLWKQAGDGYGGWCLMLHISCSWF